MLWFSVISFNYPHWLSSILCSSACNYNGTGCFYDLCRLRMSRMLKEGRRHRLETHNISKFNKCHFPWKRQVISIFFHFLIFFSFAKYDDRYWATQTSSSTWVKGKRRGTHQGRRREERRPKKVRGRREKCQEKLGRSEKCQKILGKRAILIGVPLRQWSMVTQIVHSSFRSSSLLVLRWFERTNSVKLSRLHGIKSYASLAESKLAYAHNTTLKRAAVTLEVSVDLLKWVCTPKSIGDELLRVANSVATRVRRAELKFLIVLAPWPQQQV